MVSTKNWPSILRQYQGLAGLIALMFAAFALKAPFFTLDNARNVLNQLAVPGVLAIGMTFVVLTGGIDLSVGSLLGLLNCIIATWLVHGSGVGVTAAYALFVGAAVGASLGFIIGATKMQPFVVTLAAMVSLRGAAFIYTDRRNVSGLGSQLKWVQELIGGLPTNVWILVFTTIAAAVILKKTVFGRHAYAVGGNETAARYAGVPVDRVRIAAYACNGLCVAIAAFIFTSRSGQGEPAAGLGYELDAITAVVVGGCSLFGGIGSAMGTFSGALFIVSLNVLLILKGVDYQIGQGLKGVIILVSVFLQNLGREKQ